MAETFRGADGRVYEIDSVISGRALERFLHERTNHGLYRGSQAGRCALYGGGAHDKSLPTHVTPTPKEHR